MYAYVAYTRSLSCQFSLKRVGDSIIIVDSRHCYICNDVIQDFNYPMTNFVVGGLKNDEGDEEIWWEVDVMKNKNE